MGVDMLDFKPSVSIIIPVLNGERYLAECLDSVTLLNYPAEKLEVILVDNGSTDKTLDIASSYDIRVLECLDVKVGGVRNFGVSRAVGEVVAFLDSDCVVETNWVMQGVTELNGQLEAVGGTYLLRENPAWVEAYWILDQSRDIVYKNFVGGCIFIFRDIFEGVGGFNEILSSGEDTDLTKRLRASGCHVGMSSSISVVHLGYPDSVTAFVKRQMWHSENYYQNFLSSIKDKVFVLTNLFFLGFLCVLSSPLTGFTWFITGLALMLVPPAMLSLKRIMRSKAKGLGIKGLGYVFALDILYLIGRILGSMRSFRKLIVPDSNRKYARR